jgi:hypothetical protein
VSRISHVKEFVVNSEPCFFEMRPQSHLLRKWQMLWFVLLVIASSGCGNKLPYSIVPVHGSVTYEDGSKIPADILMIAFEPTDFESGEGKVPPAGQTEVDIGNGAFHSVSSYRANDGLAVGRHRVLVAAFRSGKNGRRIPIPAVPLHYSQVSTTPIEVEITEANQELEIKVAKP